MTPVCRKGAGELHMEATCQVLSFFHELRTSDQHTSFTDSDVKRKVPGAGALMFAISRVSFCGRGELGQVCKCLAHW